MKKNVLTFGTIAGLIVSGLMVLFMGIYSQHQDMEFSMMLGYASMLVAFSFVFVGIRNYRDKYLDGTISFGKAFQVGLLISLIASTFYVVTWILEFHFFVPDFMDSYAEHVIQQAQASGATPEQLAKVTAEMASSREMYKNPVIMVLMTYCEILPVGLLVTLISALILKRKPKTIVS